MFFNKLFSSKPSLEDILSNSSLPPYSLHDFRNYLFYYEHTLENLEFLFWYDNYLIRYNQKQYHKQYKILVDASNLPNSILSLIPIGDKNLIPNQLTINTNNIVIEDQLVQFCKQTSPFCDELQDILNLFLVPNAPMELNLAYSIKKGVLLNNYLETNPERLSPIANHCYEILSQSYSKFLLHNSKLKCQCGTVKRLSPSILLYIIIIIMLINFILFQLDPLIRLVILPLLFLANLLPFITVVSSCPIQLVNQFKHTSRNCSNNKNEACCSDEKSQVTMTPSEKAPVPSSPISQWGKDPFYRYLLNHTANNKTCQINGQCSIFKDPYESVDNVHIPSLSCTFKLRFLLYSLLLSLCLMLPVYFIPNVNLGLVNEIN
ncbi:hypothetical protein K502DRAFT_342984 [Neoconidiobolus thromboides FSU 785]|nr:hypothetical protein K502DRAFT_342984 [Neoconidiobolus thromboides FSU 785]